MRIVHVIAECSAHEAMGRTVTEIAQRVPGEHFVITTTAHDGQEVFAEVVELGGAVETFPLGRREALDSALARLKPDLVHVHGGALVPLLVTRTAIPWYPNLLTMYAWPVLPSLRRLRAGGVRAAMQQPHRPCHAVKLRGAARMGIGIALDQATAADQFDP